MDWFNLGYDLVYCCSFWIDLLSRILLLATYPGNILLQIYGVYQCYFKSLLGLFIASHFVVFQSTAHDDA